MLKLMRLAAQNIFFKALLLLIILSFAIFGIGDIFHNSNDNIVEIDGKATISIQDFEKVKRNEIHKLQELLGSNLTTEQLQSLNIDNIILHRLINDKLLEIEAHNLNIIVSDNTAASYIKSEQIFQDETGLFDKNKFSTILLSNGIKERNYIDLVKKDIALKFLINTIKKQSLPLSNIAKYTYAYKTEQRIVDIIKILPQDITIAEPTEEELMQYYTTHQDKFLAPEYRKFSYIIITPKEIAKNSSFSDEELKAEYENNITDYQKPETRNILNYIFDTEEKAGEAYKNLQFDSAHKNSFLQNVTKEQLPAELRDIAFSLKEEEVSSVIKSPFGFHIIKVQAVFPSQTLTLDEAKNSPNSNLLHTVSEKKLISLRKTIEDEIAAGTTLEEIATIINLSSLIKEVDLVDNNGNDINNKHLIGAVHENYILNTAFTSAVNDEIIGLLPDNSGYFLLRVQQVLPSKAKPFIEIKSEIADSWYKHKREQETAKIAEDFASKLKQNVALNDILLSTPIAKILPAQTISRFPDQNSDIILPDELRMELFNVGINGFTIIHTHNSGYKLIGIVRKIIHKQNIDPTLMQSINAELHERLETSLLEDYLNYLHHKYPTKINYSLIKHDN